MVNIWNVKMREEKNLLFKKKPGLVVVFGSLNTIVTRWYIMYQKIQVAWGQDLYIG
jgi:hypothetical protein